MRMPSVRQLDFEGRKSNLVLNEASPIYPTHGYLCVVAGASGEGR